MVVPNAPIRDSDQAPPNTGEEPLPILRSQYGLWVQYVLNKLSPEKQKEALVAGFNSIMDHYQEQNRIFHERLRQEIRETAASLNEQKSDVVHQTRQTMEFFWEKIQKLEEEMSRDSMTNLLNKKEFLERLSLFLSTERRAKGCAVGFIDLTDFGKVNKPPGNHELGDQIISIVARQLEKTMRPCDLFARERRLRPRPEELHARHAGDQFMFMMPNAASRAVSQKVAERFPRSLEENTPQEFLDGFGHPIQADIGVVWYELDPIEVRQGKSQKLALALSRAADHCMLQGKERARRLVAKGRTGISRVYTRTVRLDVEKDRLLVQNNHNDFVETTISLTI